LHPVGITASRARGPLSRSPFLWPICLEIEFFIGLDTRSTLASFGHIGVITVSKLARRESWIANIMVESGLNGLFRVADRRCQ
jgi:hypothetical protein